MIGIATRKVHLIEVLILVIAFGWGIFTWLDILAQFGHPYGWGRLLLGGAMWVLAIGAVAWCMMYWKALRWRALLPGVLVLATFIVMSAVGSRAARQKEERFLAGTQPYLDLLQQVREGKVLPGTFPIESLPSALTGCCLQVALTKDSSGAVGGLFITEMTFGPKFAGWMYTETGQAPIELDLVGTHTQGRKVTDRWYRYAE